MTRVALILLVVAATAWISAANASAQTGCPVTLPSNATTYERPADIWTPLSSDGVIVAQRPRPGVVTTAPIAPDGSVSRKFLWRTRIAVKRLKVKGKRLDARGPRMKQVVTREGMRTTTLPSGIRFPSVGCWRLKVRAGANAPWTIVISVVDGDQATPPGRRAARGVHAHCGEPA